VALNIKDPEAERLAAEVAKMTGESKTRAIRSALADRKERLAYGMTRRDRLKDFRRLLEEEIWPSLPKTVLGRKLTRKEKERILGYGKEGF
jgi:antitoxin VapB